MRAGKSSYCLRQAKKLEPFPVVRRNCLLSTKELLFLIIAKHSRFARLVKGFCLVGCVRWCTFVPKKSEGHCLLGSMVEQLTCNEQVVGSSPTGGSRVYGLTFFLIGRSKPIPVGESLVWFRDGCGVSLSSSPRVQNNSS